MEKQINPLQMTNDKLPEEITDQIKQAAQNMLVFVPDNKYSYIAGATAWAGWKVKHDELQAEFIDLGRRYNTAQATMTDQARQYQELQAAIDDKIDKALHAERNKMQATVTASEVRWAKECHELNDQAQAMADALEELVALKCLKEESGRTNDYTKRQPIAWTKAATILQQFNDGKEVGDG